MSSNPQPTSERAPMRKTALRTFRVGWGWVRGCQHLSSVEAPDPMPIVGVTVWIVWRSRAGGLRVRNRRFYLRRRPWFGPRAEVPRV